VDIERFSRKGDFIGFGIEIPDSLYRELAHLEQRIENQILKKAIDAAAPIVEQRMRLLAPDSSVANSENATQGPTADKWSRTTKAKREPRHKLQNAMAYKFWRKKHNAMGIIGPRDPEGRHSYPLTTGHQMVLWGRRTGGHLRKRDRWIKQAYDETKSRVQSTMMSVVRAEVARIAARG